MYTIKRVGRDRYIVIRLQDNTQLVETSHRAALCAMRLLNREVAR